MYQTIYLPLDNSDHSNVSAELGLSLARRLGARVVGSHAYAAALHDVRFKQMEFTLPDEYKDEAELEKQRRIHDSLIARGLTLISDSYLQRWQLRAVELDVPFEGKHFDGKNFQVIVDDIRSSGYDLVVLGALGQGAVQGSEVGSVCERVLRRVRVDTLVVRDLQSADAAPGGIMVCIDGSAHGHGALSTACGLARSLDKHLEVIAVHGLEDGVDGDGDGELLREHLELARRHAREQRVSVSATILDGSPVEAILAHAARVRPWLVAVGRVGIDADDPDDDIGSVAERLVRRAPCNVLVSSRSVSASDLRASAQVSRRG